MAVEPPDELWRRHAMNTTFLLSDGEGIRVAPLHDVVPTLLAPGVPSTAAMFVGGP